MKFSQLFAPIALTLIGFGASGASLAGAWEYRSTSDRMTNQITSSAQMSSVNSLSLNFPHQGVNRGRLSVRVSNDDDVSVAFAIDKGSLVFDDHECCIRIRFDDAAPQAFSIIKPNDKSANVVFIRDHQRFIAAASKAKRILVEMTIFRQGQQLTEFRTAAALRLAGAKKADPDEGARILVERESKKCLMESTRQNCVNAIWECATNAIAQKSDLNACIAQPN